jgi:hypothetical protein
MSLYETIEPSLLKLKQRLAKEGIYTLLHYDYEKYLRTVLWKEIKKWIMERDNYKCVICKSEKSRFSSSGQLEVHHRSYELDVLEGKNSEMLILLCSRCHKLIEFYPSCSKRNCLQEKDKVYLDLVQVFRDVENNGLPLKISVLSRNGSTSYVITYIGNSDFLKFYSLQSLISGFVWKVIHFKHKSDIKLPNPFSVDKFFQKTGVKISDEISGKEIINVKIKDENSIIIKMSRHCIYPLHDYILSYILEQKYWYIY